MPVWGTALIALVYAFDLILFVLVFLLVRLRHPWREEVTAAAIALAVLAFLGSLAFLLFLALRYGIG